VFHVIIVADLIELLAELLAHRFGAKLFSLNSRKVEEEPYMFVLQDVTVSIPPGW